MNIVLPNLLSKRFFFCFFDDDQCSTKLDVAGAEFACNKSVRECVV